MNSLCIGLPEIKSEIIDSNAIEMIIPLIQPKDGFDACLENLLALLSSLSDNSGAKERLNFEFKEKLDYIVAFSRDKPDCKETLEYCQIIIANVYDQYRNK